MIIAVASGKGGTGKTIVATNLALSIEGSQYIDCDVEEPNGNLFLHAEIETRREAGISMPVIDEERCTLCGDCAKACEFNALAVSKERVILFSDLCHGCGACSYVCPEPGVITERLRRLGEIETGRVREANGSDIAFTGAHLDVGALLVTPLIKEIKGTRAGAVSRPSTWISTPATLSIRSPASTTVCAHWSVPRMPSPCRTR
jgi:MinD superfamily P-loop ATPase